ncbi:MAG: hypothetical protein ACRD26_05645, partial [Vicinamibacterales bacterium]
LALAMTWPLARGLARDVPGDLGDPLFVMWILSWGTAQLRAIAGGSLDRIASFFDANIFHPAPLTLAYSEHLFAQVLQVLPIHLASGNPILGYNLLFLSTFVLSGLGAFLLVRALSGSARAAFVAGLLFAFAQYRWTHVSHLQVLSAQWMPFVLYGCRRYFDTGRRRALAGAAAALTLQNLSSGYYLLYFAPMAALYVVWEMAARHRWSSRRTWADLAMAALLAALATLPFLIPYTRVRDTVQASREVGEVVRYSADVYSYLTAFGANRIWGEALRPYPKPEGDLFPGAVPLILSGVALSVWAARAARTPPPESRDRRDLGTWRWIAVGIGAIGAVYATLAAMAIFARRLDFDLVVFSIRATNVTRLLVPPAIATAAVLWLSPSTRMKVRAAARRPEAIFLAILVLAWWLSLGPAPRVMGRPLELWSPYRVLYDYIPGFDGVRAPARFAMIVTLALSVLGGLAVAHLDRIRAGAVVAGLVCAAFLVETRVMPLPVNAVSPLRDLATPEARVYRPARAPAVYHELARAPADAVVLEMPFGQPDYDVRSVYYSTVHWRRLANGYSGFFPPHYSRVMAMLSAGARGDDIAWQALQRLGVTHVVVHEGAYLDDEGARFSAWLRGHGAAEVLRAGQDLLFALPE